MQPIYLSWRNLFICLKEHQKVRQRACQLSSRCVTLQLELFTLGSWNWSHSTVLHSLTNTKLCILCTPHTSSLSSPATMAVNSGCVHGLNKCDYHWWPPLKSGWPNMLTLRKTSPCPEHNAARVSRFPRLFSSLRIQLMFLLFSLGPSLLSLMFLAHSNVSLLYSLWWRQCTITTCRMTSQQYQMGYFSI